LGEDNKREARFSAVRKAASEAAAKSAEDALEKARTGEARDKLTTGCTIGAFAVIGLLIYGVASCVMTPTPEPEKKPVVVTDGRLSSSKEFMWVRTNQRMAQQRLKDPDSAKFGDGDRVSYTSGKPIVCGTVNAKNSFGAYPGPARYIGGGDVLGIIMEGDIQDFDALWQKLC
jgi:hypothetical protein